MLLGHTVTASTGGGSAGSWNLETFLLLVGFSAGCALGFFAFRWTAGAPGREAQRGIGGDDEK
jgi:hypothetical protein